MLKKQHQEGTIWLVVIIRKHFLWKNVSYITDTYQRQLAAWGGLLPRRSLTSRLFCTGSRSPWVWCRCIWYSCRKWRAPLLCCCCCWWHCSSPARILSSDWPRGCCFCALFPHPPCGVIRTWRSPEVSMRRSTIRQNLTTIRPTRTRMRRCCCRGQSCNRTPCGEGHSFRFACKRRRGLVRNLANNHNCSFFSLFSATISNTEFAKPWVFVKISLSFSENSLNLS